MFRTRRPSPQTLSVLSALADQPRSWRYGYELGRQVGLKSGSLYPILMRLADRGLVEAAWETDPEAGRPRRHLYRLTTAGREAAGVLSAAAGAERKPARARLRGAT
jgi:PadR family transcriptional regulator, regulatory protein PadR